MLRKIVTVHHLVILVEHLSFRAFKGFCAVVTPQLHMGSLVSVCLLCVEMLSRSTKLRAGHLPHFLGRGCSGQLCAYRRTEEPESPHLLHHANEDAADAWSLHTGIHRGLGVHISKVRSCTLDTWLPEQVQFMSRTGNAAANAHFEVRMEPSQKPSYFSPELEAFIRRKVMPPTHIVKALGSRDSRHMRAAHRPAYSFDMQCSALMYTSSEW